MKNKCTWVIGMLQILLLCNCKKLIEIDTPIQNIVGKEIYNSNSGAASVLTGIYSTLSEPSFAHGTNGISLGCGLSSDELTLWDGNLNLPLEYLYQNVSNNQVGNSFWASLYSYIFKANSAIEGLNNSTQISSPIKDQLLGEALFIRAFCYFYLTNLYGSVPLLTSTDPQVNTKASRMEQEFVYQAIIKDLLESEELLKDQYVSSDATTATTERVRPNKFTAIALLARVYLFTEQWGKAETEASKIIANANYEIVPLENAFLMNSKETIWALQSRASTINNQDGLLFNYLDTDNGPNSNRPVFLSQSLYETFELGDKRKSEWIGTTTANDGTTYHFPNKYKTNANSTTVTEYPMMLRLSEQYLIRSEARARQDKLTGIEGATNDLNIVRIRAGLDITSAATKEDILQAIYKERQVELFTEWGHRWLDIKRIKVINNIMPSICQIKGTVWSDFKALYPIPSVDIQTNPNLRGSQNPGYPEQ